MTTPEDSLPGESEESSEFNLADYEIEETEEEEESEEASLAEREETTEEVKLNIEETMKESQALLRKLKEEKKKEKLVESEEQTAPLEEAPLEKVKADELYLTLSVEAGTIQLPFKELLELKSGSVLEIGLSPEQGVNLMVGNQCIGKGELVKIGDAIGVRILDI